MRNPFRRKQKLPGAESAWDEGQHIRVDDDYVAVPEDQLPADYVERLEGVKLYELPDGEGLGVFVNVDAVEAETEAWVANYDFGPDLGKRLLRGETPPGPTDAEMRQATEDAYNNPANWMRDGIESMADDDARYALFPVDLTTGRIGRH